MKLENNFNIPVPTADAWKVLLDLERIAPCVPGAEVTSRQGDEFNGKMKVKLGPIGLTYKGVIKIVSRDESAHVAVLEGGAREARGNGTAKALITCRLAESGDTTDVFVETDLDITGKPAQFGRGTLNEVAEMLIGKFADNLAEELSAVRPDADGAVTEPEETSTGASTASPDRDGNSEIADAGQSSAPKVSQPLDLLQATGFDAGLKKVLPAVVLVLTGFLAGIAFARRSKN
ncbi:UNVERIFIED_CONTAM: carbon monoxide dehydrogenase subunit G [Williamsia faeni]